MTRRRDLPAPARPAPDAGFTLIEIVVVVTILGLMLLLVPARLDGFGASSRLDSSTNTIASVLTAAHEQAIIDGNPVIVLFDVPKARFAYRVTQRTHKSPKELRQPGADSTLVEEDEDDSREEEWVDLPWRDLPDGVRIAGVSIAPGDWRSTNPGGEPFQIWFFPDGSLKPPAAILVEGDPDLPEASRTRTVVVNALTSLAEVLEGKVELPAKRSPDEFR